MKITIIGKGQGWEDAPTDGETWGVNDLFKRRDVKLIFAMDNLETRLSTWAEGIEEYTRKNCIPVVGQKAYSFLPISIIFPIKEMHTDYFVCTISYMIAYAIFKGATQIDLYGCTLWGGSEYSYQKPNVEYWIGYAQGKGIKVNIHGRANLLKSHNNLIYGYNLMQGV